MWFPRKKSGTNKSVLSDITSQKTSKRNKTYTVRCGKNTLLPSFFKSYGEIWHNFVDVS